MIKSLFWRSFRTTQLFLIDHQSHTGFFSGQRDDPKPFVGQSNNDGIESLLHRWQPHIGKVAEDGNFPMSRMDDAKTFDITRKITAATGIDEEFGSERMNLVVRRARLDPHASRIRCEPLDTPAFPDIGSGFTSVLQQNVVKSRTFDVKGFRFTIECALSKDDVIGQRSIG